MYQYCEVEWEGPILCIIGLQKLSSHLREKQMYLPNVVALLLQNLSSQTLEDLTTILSLVIVLCFRGVVMCIVFYFSMV